MYKLYKQEGKVCEIPTMEAPFKGNYNTVQKWEDDWENDKEAYKHHLASLKEYDIDRDQWENYSEGQELSESEFVLQCQSKNGEAAKWWPCEYNNEWKDLPVCNRRVLARPNQGEKNKVLVDANKIAEILRDNIYFSPQGDQWLIHGAIEKLINLFKEWHNELSQPKDVEKGKSNVEKAAEEMIRELLYMGFASAAGAFRLYPDDKHTFADNNDYLINQGKKIFAKWASERLIEAKQERERLVDQNLKLMKDNVHLMSENEATMKLNLILANEVKSLSTYSIRLREALEKIKSIAFSKSFGERSFSWYMEQLRSITTEATKQKE